MTAKRIYTVAIDYAPGPVDTDYFEIQAAVNVPIIFHGFSLGTLNDNRDLIIKVILLRRTGIGTGSTALTEEPLDPDTSTASTSVAQRVTTPGASLGANLKVWYWNHAHTLEYWPHPDARIKLEAGDVLSLWSFDEPLGINVGGYLIFEEI